MASEFYTPFLESCLSAEIDLPTNGASCLLVGSTFTFTASDEFVSDITGEHADVTYNRQPLTALTITGGVIDAADLSFGPLEGSDVYGLIVFQNGASDAARRLICYLEFPSPETPNGQTFDIAFDASGIAALNT